MQDTEDESDSHAAEDSTAVDDSESSLAGDSTPAVTDEDESGSVVEDKDVPIDEDWTTRSSDGALGTSVEDTPSNTTGSIDEDLLDEIVFDDDEDTDEASRGLFDDLLSGEPIFENKEVLRPSYTPRKLPHREEQINNMATILVAALRGDTPSNILIYGKTGTGKTASAKFVSEELERTSEKYEVPCDVEYINCEVTDTQYRVLAQLANTFIENNEAHIEDRLAELEDLQDRAEADPNELEGTEFATLDAVDAEIESLEADLESFETVPMTGWPTDRVYSTFFDAVDYTERVVVIMLDEIDKLVEKSGDDTLYNLSRMNNELQNSRVSIMGISNDLKFTDFLDPRVKSSLGEEEIVFPPYDANQLRDILQARADVAFKDDALSDDVIPLCAAFAAQEHGDARRALDLLRTAGELAERDQIDLVAEDHVRQAQEKIELDRVVEVVRTLPTQSKLVLFSIILLEKNGVHNINTGEVYNIYKRLCEEIDADVLTQRRVTDLISELDMLGIVNAVVVSKGRYGRTKEISLSVPLDETEAVLHSDSRLGDIEDVQPFIQARFDQQ
ncbi:ORC1-type DNA replication protein [Halorhabdus sp. BNX81]|uniref:Cdc6/Cdc18 family protein n=1 Tax=Halorhabdus sp. BNX81 TaxID=2980181 RepID=UPI0023DD0F82|nr:ORC1-type DNA replication protein [Halorhabdus sp. BNX81]WEL20080.1 Cdc6-related protein, AAA superfamily ATPase [Halorhabdus sp. BNX81]